MFLAAGIRAGLTPEEFWILARYISQFALCADDRLAHANRHSGNLRGDQGRRYCGNPVLEMMKWADQDQDGDANPELLIVARICQHCS
jgi:hypothetical protein